MGPTAPTPTLILSVMRTLLHLVTRELSKRAIRSLYLVSVIPCSGLRLDTRNAEIG